ncbi:cupin [Candidatus Peregrinibacteria bacterium]|nr:cupin [Candidatus Peregrinibacteria bacterium]
MRGKFLADIQIKPKPWGREIWFAWTPHYAGKILEIKKGHRFSLQYHEKKWETQLVIEGKVKFTYGTHSAGMRLKKMRTKILQAGEKVDIPAGMIHRAQALEKTVIFEVSSPELDDVVKLEDDYGRIGKGNNEKLDKKLAKIPRS